MNFQTCAVLFSPPVDFKERSQVNIFENVKYIISASIINSNAQTFFNSQRSFNRSGVWDLRQFELAAFHLKLKN